VLKANKLMYLVTAAKDLKGFIDQSDRNYFSRPVPVRVICVVKETRLVYVTDPNRNHSYHCDPRCLRSEHALTCKQRALIGLS